MKVLKLLFNSRSMVFLLLFYACKPKSITNAHVQHEFENTSIKHREFSPCQASDLRHDLPETHRYLRDIKDHIVKSNPKTFSGVLTSENLCMVLSKQDTGIGGGAFGNSGRIEIEAATIKNAANDAELAAVVCHELAHISMQHIRTVQTGASGEKLDFTNGKGPDHYFKKISNIPEYEREKEELDKMFLRKKEIESELIQVNKEQEKLALLAIPSDIMKELKLGEQGLRRAIDFLARCKSDECEKLKQAVSKTEMLAQEKFELHNTLIPAQEYLIYKIVAASVPSEVFLTWAEREADEVGLELCVRAGFDTEALKAIPRRRLAKGESTASLATYAGCRAAIAKALPDVARSRDPYGRVHEIPIVNSAFPGEHPENCWRLFNLERELILHAKDYRPFHKNHLNIIQGGLEKAKQELATQKP